MFGNIVSAACVTNALLRISMAMPFSDALLAVFDEPSDLKFTATMVSVLFAPNDSSICGNIGEPRIYKSLPANAIFMCVVIIIY